MSTELTKEFETAESRHAHVDEEGVWPGSAECLQSRAGIDCSRRIVTGHPEHPKIRPCHGFIVVNDQDMGHEGGLWHRGMRKNCRELPLREEDNVRIPLPRGQPCGRLTILADDLRGGHVSPIFVRPVREQLEHDRLIRYLQARYKRKFEAGINVGDEQAVPVKIGPSTFFPDLVLTDGRKLAGLVEVETGESVNNLEAMAQWVHFSRARVPFHLYVPVQVFDAARRLSAANHVKVAEIWTYRPSMDGFDLVRMFHDGTAAPLVADKPAKAKAPAPAPPPPKPAAKPAPVVKAVAPKAPPAKKPAKPAKPVKAAKKPAKPAKSKGRSR
jgi:hypothetical protein